MMEGNNRTLYSWKATLETIGMTEGNNRTIVLVTKNPINHSRTKYIDIQFHFIQDKLNSNQVRMPY